MGSTDGSGNSSGSANKEINSCDEVGEFIWSNRSNFRDTEAFVSIG